MSVNVLAARAELVELAKELADVDEPGTWWTLPLAERAGFERMAEIARGFAWDDRYDEGWDDGYEAGRGDAEEAE